MWPFENSARKQVRILSFDGGGIRGLLSARILEALMARVGRSVQDTFHLVAGTSTGSLIGLTQVRQNPRAVDQVADLYYDFGPDIFSNSRTWRVRNNWGLRGPKYPNQGLKRGVSFCADDEWLSDSQVDFLVPAFDLQSKKPHWFRSWEAHDPALDFYLKDVGLASASAPTFFPAAQVKSRTGEDRYFIDGGLFANNPSMQAVKEARKLYPKAQEVLLVSIGTGAYKPRIPLAKAQNWGLLAWLSPLIDILHNVNEEAVLEDVAETLGTQPYFRFDFAMDQRREGVKNPSSAMDLVSKRNLQRMEDLAEAWIGEKDQALNTAAAALRAPLASSKALGRQKR